MNDLDEFELGWVVEIIEGEGSAFTARTGKTRKVRGYIQVAMCDRDVIERLRDVTGVGTVSVRYRQQSHHRTCWSWRVADQRDVLDLALAISPYMSERRRDQISEVGAAASHRIANMLI